MKLALPRDATAYLAPEVVRNRTSTHRRPGIYAYAKPADCLRFTCRTGCTLQNLIASKAIGTSSLRHRSVQHHSASAMFIFGKLPSPPASCLIQNTKDMSVSLICSDRLVTIAERLTDAFSVSPA